MDRGDHVFCAKYHGLLPCGIRERANWTGESVLWKFSRTSAGKVHFPFFWFGSYPTGLWRDVINGIIELKNSRFRRCKWYWNYTWFAFFLYPFTIDSRPCGFAVFQISRLKSVKLQCRTVSGGKNGVINGEEEWYKHATHLTLVLIEAQIKFIPSVNWINRLYIVVGHCN